MAVPGSICSPASRGVNALLREGAIPACTPENVLEELMTLVRGSSMEFGSDVGGVPGAGGVPGVGDVPNVSTQTLHVRDGRQQARREALLNAEEKAVLAAVEWEPTATDDVLLRTGLPLGTVAMSLMALERGGFLHGHEGRWWRSE